jgi:hypothetical protein
VIDFARLEKVADAVLYEGYLLYPYDPRALKNQRRWTFGCLLPEPWSAALGEPSWHQTECLVRGDAASRIAVRARFLYLHGADAVDAHIDAPTLALREGRAAREPAGTSPATGGLTPRRSPFRSPYRSPERRPGGRGRRGDVA